MIPGISETASWVLLFVTVAASVVYAWYRWEVFQSMFGGVFKQMQQQRVEQRTAELLARHRAQQADRAEREQPPALRLIRVGQRDGEHLLLLHNDGGFAQNVTVATPDGTPASVQPADRWRPDQPVTLRLHTPADRVPVQFTWQDALGTRHTARYTASLAPPGWKREG